MAEKEPFEGILDESTAAWVRGKTIEDLAIVDVGGDAYLQETIARFDTRTKKLVDEPVLARFPNTLDYSKARAKAIAYVEKDFGRPPHTLTIEGAQALAGEDFDHIERLHLFELILRNPAKPEIQYMFAESIGRAHPHLALLELEVRITMARNLVTRQLLPQDLDNPAIFWAIVEGIARKKNLSPLAGIVGAGTDAFIIAMASQLSDSRTKQSSPS